MIGGNLNYGSSSLPIYWNNGIPTPITSYEGTAAKAISDDDGNNIKNTYASNLTFTNGLLILKNKNGIALDTITLDTLTVSDITTGTEDVRKLITAKVFKDSVDSLISQLNVNEKTFANGEVLKTLKEENGKIGLTTGQLSIDGGILAGSYVINLKEDNSSFSQLSIGQMQGATATTPGAVGLVPQTVAGDQEKFLRGDGQWIIPTNTDYQVRQTNTSADKDYRVLLSYSDTNNEETNTVYKHSGLLYNPSSNTLTVTYIEGRAATAGRANADSLGNVINTTYALKTATVSNIEWNSTNKKLTKTINGIESDVINFVAGDNITFTSDNTGLTIAATDTNTTYSLSGSRSAVNYTMLLTPSSGSATQAVIPTMTPATADAGGLLGLVPNSAPGDQNKFLRADGTWVVPTNTNNKVQSVKTDSSDANYKILFSYTDTNSNETNYVRKDSDFYYNPSSNTLTVTQVAGNAQTASKANADSAGNIIINTYAKKSEALTSIIWDKTNKKLIKTINGTDSDVLEFIAGNNVTLTADDNKITITTANDNTTYGLSGTLTGNTFVTTLTAGGTGVQSTVPAMSAASASVAGRAGLVPAPQAGDNTKVLSGAGTWIEQSSYSLPLASSSTRGGIKIGFESNPNTKNYALLLDDEKAYVNVPWTDRSVEGPGYHYVPQEDSASLLSASATGGTASWGIDVVQGVKVRRDNRGHITGLEVISGKIPDQPTYPNDRDPGYGSITIDTASTAVNVPTAKKNTATITAATYSERLILSPTNKWIVMGATDNSSTGLDKVYIGHNISTVTKGSYGPSTDVNVTNGGNFKVPYISVDEAGHITGASTKTITLPITSDTKVTQYNFTQNSDLRVILSNSATGNEETATVNKSNNLIYNPSTNKLSTGNLDLTGALNIVGNAYLHNQTMADSLTAGSLIVNGNANFVQSPTAPTPASGDNSTKLATTEFVKTSVAGLSGAMHFKGTTTTEMTDGRTTAVVTVGGASYTPAAGDVVLYSDSEFVWTGSAWERLGRDSSFKITQSVIDSGTAATNKWVSRIQQNANGEITATMGTLDTSGTWSGKVAKLTDLNSSDSASLTTDWRKVWFNYSDGVTGRPALSDAFAFQTSTGTLKATIFSGSGASLISLNASNISSGTLAAARLPSVTRTNNTSTASPAHNDTFTTIDNITTDTYGRVTAVNTKTITLPSDNNTTYTFAEGSTNGTFSVTPSGGSAQSVLIHGLGTAAYKAEDYYVKRSGDTMSGSLQVINTANNTAGLKITLETQSYNFGFHMGTGGVNHGLYDFKASKWVILGDASHNWTFNGNLNGKLTTARKLKVNLEATADTSFDGSADVLNIPTTGNLSTQRLARPRGLRGVSDVTLQALINSARANRLAFLPADQIIIEKTIDGGTTWVDAGVSDSQKLALFSEQRPNILIPTLNGVRDQLCGLRITITAMKYNVPAGTPETEKYNYWNSTYVQSQERYCQLKDMYFWLIAVNDSIGVTVQRATGVNSTSWSTIFNDNSYYMTGWSGCDYINFSQNTFGGGINQTSNYWNYRIILMTKGVNGTTNMATSSTTASQAICEIRAYGDTVWGVPNRYMAYDHMYSFDANKNVAFPAKVTATEFVGNIAWNNITGKPSVYYTLPTATDSTLGGIKTGYSASEKNYAIKVDSNGNAYVNVPWTDNNTTSFTITANATDGLWDLTGTNGTNAVTYTLAPYSTKQSSTSFYTAATNPTLTTRLNYDGYFYATKLYSGGVEVLTSHQSLANYKTKQTAVSDPTASNTAIAFIDSISQDANGVITPTKKTVRSASISQTGVVQLSSATNSTSETLAATAKAVKTAYDLANDHKYWANVESTSAAQYDKQPEVKSVTIGNGSGTTAATKKVQMVYDATLEVLNFVFS